MKFRNALCGLVAAAALPLFAEPVFGPGPALPFVSGQFADINGDGADDFLRYDDDDNFWFVHFNDGTGHYDQGRKVEGLEQYDLISGTGDRNGDGLADLLVPSYDMMVYLGDGKGTFTPVASVFATMGVEVDLNRDALIDTIFYDNDYSTQQTTITPAMTRPDGTLDLAPSFRLNNTVASIVAADYTGDRINDLVFLGRSSTIQFMQGLGNGTFAMPQPLHTGRSLGGLIAGDFDRDGKADLVFHEFVDQTSTVTILLGDGTGSFPSAMRLPVWTAPAPGNRAGAVISLIAWDVAGDREPELLFAQTSGEIHTARVTDGRLAIFDTMLAGRPAPALRKARLRANHNDLAVHTHRDGETFLDAYVSTRP